MQATDKDQLEIGEDLQHERREWRVQALGRMVCVAFLAAAVLGLCGPGPLSRASVTAAGLQVDYERFAHYGRATPLKIVLQEAVGPEPTELSLWLAESWASRNRIEEIVPEPLRTEQRNERLVLILPAGDPGPILIRMRLRPEVVGIALGEIGIEGGPSVSFHQTVYP